MPLLDLSKADTSGFDALPSGTYDCEVVEVTMKETKGGENAKLPKGTPMFNVQFKVIGKDGEIGESYEHYNRRLFSTYVIAPDKVDGKKYEHKAKMDGMLVKFFTAIGYDEAEVTGGGFDPDLNDLKGRECRVTAKMKPKYNTAPEDKEFDNEVSSVKPAGAVSGASGGLL